MGSLIAGLGSVVVGGLLAVGTITVVATQASENTDNPPATQVVDYGQHQPR